MKKYLVLLTLVLAGCATTDNVKLTTKTVPVAVPLIYSPLPPVVARPDLPHLLITPADAKVDGKVVQAYAASVKALLDYSEQLELIISNYKNINDAYAQLRAKVIADWKTNTGVDITVPDPTLPANPPSGLPPKPGDPLPPSSTAPGVPSDKDLANHP